MNTAAANESNPKRNTMYAITPLAIRLLDAVQDRVIVTPGSGERCENRRHSHHRGPLIAQQHAQHEQKEEE